MSSLFGVRALLALAVAAVAALAGFLLNGDFQASLVVLVCASAAVLIASAGDEIAPPPPPAAPEQGDPPTADVIEAIAEPVLVIAGNRVVAANRPRASCSAITSWARTCGWRSATRQPPSDCSAPPTRRRTRRSTSSGSARATSAGRCACAPSAIAASST
ncbi:MAG: hypothetical protein WDN44_16180 [Sphingomonas sp.]